MLLAAAVALGMFLADGLYALAPTLPYEVAFAAAAAGATHSLHRARALDHTAWHLGEGGRAGVFLTSSVLELALLLLVAGLLARWMGHVLPASSLVGILQLAAVALLVARLALRPSTAVTTFFVLVWVVPSLIPALQPMLDARRCFHPGGFPGWIGALAPILALVFVALALPARARSSSETTSA